MWNDRESRIRLSRRTILSAVGALGAGGVIGAVAGAAPAAKSRPRVAGSCTLIPQETEGPYPLRAILSNSSIVRGDVTEGRPGVPLTLQIKLQNINDNCLPISNAAVYIWHCDKDGVYSGYSQPGVNTVGQTFMRGVQVSDADGAVNFATIFPGWYIGRLTHIHFQVYLANNLGGTAIATSQIAFPFDIVRDVYHSSLYAAHGQNTSVTTFAADNVFNDGATYQMLALSGSVAAGYVGTLTVGIAGLGAGTASEIDRTMNWAESVYATLFSPTKPATQSMGGYTYRYYADSQTYLGVKSGRVYLLGPITNQQISDLGSFNTFFDQARAAGY